MADTSSKLEPGVSLAFAIIIMGFHHHPHSLIHKYSSNSYKYLF
jgi:hypothetical protein